MSRNVPPEPEFSLCHLVFVFAPLTQSREEKGAVDRLLWVLHNTNILARAKIAPVEVAVKVSCSLIPSHCGVHVWSSSRSDRCVK